MTGPTYDERRTSFGGAADSYATYRPGYPAAAIEWALAGATNSATRVVDVGAGTGALTMSLVDRGLQVTAIEPDAAMLEQLSVRLPEVTVHVAGAEVMPLPDASVDAVFVAQAWHWMEHLPAAEEFARVTRPGGVVAILWNVRLLEVPWMRELGDLIGGEDSMRAAVRVRAADDPDAITLGTRWSNPERGEFHHEVSMTVDSLVGLVGTYSYVRLRADSVDVLDQVRRIAEAEARRVGSDSFPMPYVTVVYRAVRL